jgi:hypothetical protein
MDIVISPEELTLRRSCPRCDPSGAMVVDMLDALTIGPPIGPPEFTFLCPKHLKEALLAMPVPTEPWEDVAARMERHAAARRRVELPIGRNAYVTTIWFDEIGGEKFKNKLKNEKEWAREFIFSVMAAELNGQPPIEWQYLPWFERDGRVFASGLIEIRKTGIAAFLRRVWPWMTVAESAADITIVDELKEPRAAAFRELARGVELLRNFERRGGGRPYGSGDFPVREEYEELVITVVEELVLAQKRVTQEVVAEYLDQKRPVAPHREGKSPDARQLRAWNHHHVLDWQAMKAEGIRRAKSRP